MFKTGCTGRKPYPFKDVTSVFLNIKLKMIVFWIFPKM